VFPRGHDMRGCSVVVLM